MGEGGGGGGGGWGAVNTENKMIEVKGDLGVYIIMLCTYIFRRYVCTYYVMHIHFRRYVCTYAMCMLFLDGISRRQYKTLVYWPCEWDINYLDFKERLVCEQACRGLGGVWGFIIFGASCMYFVFSYLHLFNTVELVSHGKAL